MIGQNKLNEPLQPEGGGPYLYHSRMLISFYRLQEMVVFHLLHKEMLENLGIRG